MDPVKSFFAVLRWVEALTILLVSLRAAPAIARASGDFLCRAFSVFLSPCFLFLVGNAIVLLLFFKYRNLNAAAAEGDNGNDDNYDTVKVYDGIMSFLPPPVMTVLPEEAAEVVYEDKEVVSSSSDHHHVRTCRRSKSERKASPAPDPAPPPPPPPELRRSKTELTPEDDAEEFRRTIEAFIEKQLKFQREELMSNTTAAPATNMLAIVSAEAAEEGGKEKE